MLLHSQFYQLLYINRIIRRLTITQINYRIHKNNCRRYSTSSWTKNLITYEINMLNNLLFNPLWRYPVGLGIFSSTGLKLDVCRKFLHPPKARFCSFCRIFSKSVVSYWNGVLQYGQVGDLSNHFEMHSSWNIWPHRR